MSSADERDYAEEQFNASLMREEVERVLITTISRDGGGRFTYEELTDIRAVFEDEGWTGVRFRPILLDPSGMEYEVFADADSNPYRKTTETVSIRGDVFGGSAAERISFELPSLEDDAKR